MQALDRVLRGGCACGSITELVGPAGIGKTQLCLQLAAIAASLPVDVQSNQVCSNAHRVLVTACRVAAAMLPVPLPTISSCARCCQCCHIFQRQVQQTAHLPGNFTGVCRGTNLGLMKVPLLPAAQLCMLHRHRAQIQVLAYRSNCCLAILSAFAAQAPI